MVRGGEGEGEGVVGDDGGGGGGGGDSSFCASLSIENKKRYT